MRVCSVWMRDSFLALLMLSFRACVHGLWIHDSSFTDLLPASFDLPSSVPVNFKGHCALLCQRDSTCKGFFYNEGNKECIVTSSVFLRSGSEMAAEGSRYYRSTPVTCPSDGEYVLHEQSGTCFQLNHVPKTWTAARDACSAAHGSLAILDTLDKEETLIDFFLAGYSLYIYYPSYYYIGGHRPYSAWDTAWPNGQPDFLWLSGQPVDWTTAHWKAGDPSNGAQQENALAIQGDYGWYLIDVDERNAYNYVCEFALF